MDDHGKGVDSLLEATPKQRAWPVLLLALLCVTMLWAGCWLLLKGDPERGTFGDMFGTVNALFSGMAFAALVYTVWMQREELSLQRQELKLTRGEMAGQRLEMKAQNETFTRQRFESTFFALLSLHQQNVALISAPGVSQKGRELFTYLRDDLDRIWKLLIPDGVVQREMGLPRTQRESLAGQAYGQLYDEQQGRLGHYFRHLYHIIKFVDESDVPDKKRYTNFVRAQLSNNELAILFYNGLSFHGVDKFKPLIEKYALLKTMPLSALLQQHHAECRGQAFSDGPIRER